MTPIMNSDIKDSFLWALACAWRGGLGSRGPYVPLPFSSSAVRSTGSYSPLAVPLLSEVCFPFLHLFMEKTDLEFELGILDIFLT